MIKFLTLLFSLSLLVSCSLEEELVEKVEISIELDGIPTYCHKYYLKIITWKNDDVLDEINFDEILYDTSLFEKKINVSSDFTDISFFLYDDITMSENPKFFMQLKNNTNFIYTPSYWLFYNSYFISNKTYFGISKKFAIEMQAGDKVDCSFENRPYYYFKYKPENKDFKINITGDPSDFFIQSGNSYLAMLRNGNTLDLKMNDYNFFLDNTDETIHLVIKPRKLDEAAYCEIKLENLSKDDKYYHDSHFKYDEFIYGRDKSVYFSTTPNLTSGDKNTLKKVDYRNNIVTTLKTFDNEIIDIYSNTDNSVIFLYEGCNIWELNINTSILSLKHTSKEPMMYLLHGKGYFIYYYRYDEYYYNTSILDSTTFEVLHTIKDTSAPFYDASNYVYSDINNEFYYLCYNELYTLKVDFSSDKVLKNIGDQSFRYSSLSSIREISPNQTRVITDCGKIFNPSIKPSSIESIGYSALRDITLNDKYIFIINDQWLKVLDINDYSLLSTPIVYEGYLEKELIIDNDSLIIVSSNFKTNKVDIYEYDIENLVTSKNILSPNINTSLIMSDFKAVN